MIDLATQVVILVTAVVGLIAAIIGASTLGPSARGACLETPKAPSPRGPACWSGTRSNAPRAAAGLRVARHAGGSGATSGRRFSSSGTDGRFLTG